ncbi:signal peptidase I [Nakamurella deserti]|uniref:signal peptidase I n=1 Tax=Nakamurella deserti TaxID=2164074 RepID=UPI000DBE5788|nr:signal peptidase I [Nakamurella deserti]
MSDTGEHGDATPAGQGGTAGPERAADPPAERPRSGRRRPFRVELPILLVLAFLATFVIQTFVVEVYYIPSRSMEQTLHGATSGGDRVLVNRIVYEFSDPKPGEVVVFRGPPSWAPEVAAAPGPSTWFATVARSLGSVVGVAPPDEKDFVKRVIATAGPTVACCDARGRVTVDGRSLDEPYLYEDWAFVTGTDDCTTAPRSQRCFGPVTVPADALWLMGDHRGASGDSALGCRGDQPVTGCRGPVPVDDVIGHAVLVVAPVSRWGVIGSPDLGSGG